MHDLHSTSRVWKGAHVDHNESHRRWNQITSTSTCERSATRHLTTSPAAPLLLPCFRPTINHFVTRRFAALALTLPSHSVAPALMNTRFQAPPLVFAPSHNTLPSGGDEHRCRSATMHTAQTIVHVDARHCIKTVLISYLPLSFSLISLHPFAMTLDPADFSSQHSDSSIQDHPEWQDGDFVLVSSDGWRFKAPSELLFRSRLVPWSFMTDMQPHPP